MEKYNISMPVDAQKQDTYPIGAAFDFSCTNQILLDEEGGKLIKRLRLNALLLVKGLFLSPQPMLHVLSSGGALFLYHICSRDQSRPSLIM
jgi:hypothetical protein